jgi:methylmalonyl-CoA/ethylmalonyl-CoA epimerase
MAGSEANSFDRSNRLRRLDHVAIAVHSPEAAIEYLSGRLGLGVVHVEELDDPPVRLTYLDAGNAFIQLVSPRVDDCDLARWLAEHGPGLHHICFGVDDVEEAVAFLSDGELPRPKLSRGRGRPSAFLAVDAPIGNMMIECTALVASSEDRVPLVSADESAV